MNEEESSAESLAFSEVTRDKLDDFRTLMARKGCWCLLWRLPGEEFKTLTNGERKDKMENIIESGIVPGILAYVEGKPVAWCSIAPRDSFPKLSSSRPFKPVDGEPVWSIVCFYVETKHRGNGLTSRLILESIDYAAKRGARIVEANPIDPDGHNPNSSAAYTGFFSTFLRLGFVEVARRSERRPIMRYYISNSA